MNEEKIQQLKDALMELFQAIQNSGEEITGDLETMLVQAMEYIANRIQQLRSEGQQVPSAAPEMTESMPSSNVEGFAYDDNSNRLYVRFLGKHPNRFGPVYQYENVPPNIFEIFRKGAIPAKTDGKNKWGRWWKGKYPSMGAAMYHMIRAAGFPYQRVS